MKAITCFLPYIDAAQAQPTIEALKAEPAVERICLLAGADADTANVPEGCTVVNAAEGLNSSATMRAIAAAADTEFILLYTKHNKLVPGYHALERMLRIAADCGAGMLYADSYAVAADGKRTNAPVIDYQEGSLRDDFNFGSPVSTTCACASAASLPSCTSTSISTPTWSLTTAAAAKKSSTMWTRRTVACR